MHFLEFLPSNLLMILYKLTKFEAPSLTVFLRYQVSMSKFAKGNN